MVKGLQEKDTQGSLSLGELFLPGLFSRASIHLPRMTL